MSVISYIHDELANVKTNCFVEMNRRPLRVAWKWQSYLIELHAARRQRRIPRRQIFELEGLTILTAAMT